MNLRQILPLALLVVAASPVLATAGSQTKAPPPAEGSAVATTMIANGLSHPWALQFLPDGRMLVTERPGRLRIVTPAGEIGPAIANVPEVVGSGQGGLLDVALAPDFATSSEIFISYAEPRPGGVNGTSVARARLKTDNQNGGTLEDVRVIFRQEPAASGTYHFGSRIVFANDGTLFVTTGDRYALKDEAQNPKTHIGKVIRITKDGDAAPGAPVAAGWDAKVWSIGHRNLQGATVDPATGDLWTVEHGARGGDELNRPQAGRNYGWPVITYGRDYTFLEIGEGTAKAGMEQPVYYWDPSIAPSGLVLYSGKLFPGWKGNLLVGALAGTHLSRLVMENGAVVAEERLLTDLDERIRDVREGPDGAVYVVTDDRRNGKIIRVTPAK